VPEWAEKQVYRGPEVGEFLRRWAETWQDWHFDVTEVRDTAGNLVFAGIHEWGTGAESGVGVDQYRYLIFTVGSGRIMRVRMFSDRAEALEAAGLSEQAMSQENVENLDAMLAAFNRRDFDQSMRYLDPDVEINPGVMAPDHDAQLIGHRGWREFIRVAIEVWETVSVEPKQRIETEDSRILSVDLWRLRGRESIEIDRELPTLFTFRDGLIVRIDGFIDKADALEAAGLSE
jgi:ketosteroid isomerase-like protein